MNKQIVLASLMGAAMSQTVCEDAFVKQAQATKAAAEAKKVTLAAEKTSLAALATAEATATTAAKTAYDKQVTLRTPFNTAFATADTNHSTKVAAVAAATTAITALATPIATATTALTAANAAVTAQNVKINAQKAVNVKLDAAVTEHTTLLATMTSELATAVTALATATTAATAATTAKNALVTARAATTGTIGTTKLKTDATTAVTTATNNLTTPVSEEASTFADYKTKNMTFLKQTKLTADYLAACVYTNHDCKTYDNDPVKALWTAANSALTAATSPKTTAKSAWDLKVTALANVQDLKNQADQALLFATDQDTTAGSAITTATGAETTANAAKTTATAAQTTATTNKTSATAQKAQAVTDAARGTAALAKLTAALVPLTDAVVIATYNKKIQDDKKTAQEAAKTLASANLTDLKTLRDMAKETVDRAGLRVTFYKGLYDTADAAKKLIDGKVTANTTAIANNAAAITAATTNLAATIATCKGVGYAKAQEAMKQLLAKRKAEAAQYATVKTAYDAKYALPTGGETGSDCAFPLLGADGVQKPRPVCKEGYCCGAAQRFMRDGTKLSVETCQKNKGVTTYTFLPPLPKNAQVEPTPQTWRFSCISGAKQLAATATAALAATYMMA